MMPSIGTVPVGPAARICAAMTSIAAARRRMSADRLPPHAWFVGSAVFHYLGPAFAVLLFARVGPLGTGWLRIAAAALVLCAWRRPWRLLRRLALGTVAAIEFLPVIALAALGAHGRRNAAALALAVAGVYLLTGVRLSGEPLGFALAFANAGLFALYIVLGHRVAGATGIDGLAASMLAALVVVTPLALWNAVPALDDPVALGAGLGVGVASSVIPYVCDQLAMLRLARATYALLVSLLPATATLIGVVVLGQLPSLEESLGVALVI